MIRQHILSLLLALSTTTNITDSNKQFLATIIDWNDRLVSDFGGKDGVDGTYCLVDDQMCVADYYESGGCNKSIGVLYTVESEWLTVENKANQALWKIHLTMGGTMVFRNTEEELTIVTVDNHAEVYGRNIKNPDFYEATIIGLETVGGDKFIIPELRLDDKIELSSDTIMTDEDQQSFYKFALLAVKDKRIERRLKYLRKEDTNNVTSLTTYIRTFIMSDGRSSYPCTIYFMLNKVNFRHVPY